MHTHKAWSHTKTQAQSHTQENTRRQVHAKSNFGIATHLTKYLVIAAGAISTTEHTRVHTRTHEQVHHTHKTQSHTKTQIQSHTQEDKWTQKTTPASPHAWQNTLSLSLVQFPQLILHTQKSTNKHKNTHPLTQSQTYIHTRAHTLGTHNKKWVSEWVSEWVSKWVCGFERLGRNGGKSRSQITPASN